MHIGVSVDSVASVRITAKGGEEVIDALPQHIRLGYLIRESSATICCDGFLSIFYTIRFIN